jgi:vacuolar-type H+-ATPase subunit H
MAVLLAGLYQGQWLSPQSREVLLGAMSRCRTGIHRLKAMLPSEAMVGHKTGTLSNTSSDVGLIRAADGRTIAIAIYVTGQGGKPGAMRDRHRARVYEGIRPSRWAGWQWAVALGPHQGALARPFRQAFRQSERRVLCGALFVPVFRRVAPLQAVGARHGVRTAGKAREGCPPRARTFHNPAPEKARQDYFEAASEAAESTAEVASEAAESAAEVTSEATDSADEAASSVFEPQADSDRAAPATAAARMILRMCILRTASGPRATRSTRVARRAESLPQE